MPNLVFSNKTQNTRLDCVTIDGILVAKYLRAILHEINLQISIDFCITINKISIWDPGLSILSTAQKLEIKLPPSSRFRTSFGGAQKIFKVSSCRRAAECYSEISFY